MGCVCVRGCVGAWVRRFGGGLDVWLYGVRAGWWVWVGIGVSVGMCALWVSAPKGLVHGILLSLKGPPHATQPTQITLYATHFHLCIKETRFLQCQSFCALSKPLRSG